MRRDRITFGMMIGLPIIQLVLFGFAINADPRHLPTLVEMGDNGPLSRALIVSGMQQLGLFRLPGRGDAARPRARKRCGAATRTSWWSSRRISSATWCGA